LPEGEEEIEERREKRREWRGSRGGARGGRRGESGEFICRGDEGGGARRRGAEGTEIGL
jgi:hypothetical protein